MVLLVASIPIAIEIVCTTTLALGSRQLSTHGGCTGVGWGGVGWRETATNGPVSPLGWGGGGRRGIVVAG